MCADAFGLRVPSFAVPIVGIGIVTVVVIVLVIVIIGSVFVVGVGIITTGSSVSPPAVIGKPISNFLSELVSLKSIRATLKFSLFL